MNKKKFEKIFDVQFQLNNVMKKRFFDSRIDILDELHWEIENFISTKEYDDLLILLVVFIIILMNLLISLKILKN